jgi:hypothetical protein
LELDKLSHSCPGVPVDHFVTGSQLRIDELVHRDRAVGEISRGQVRAFPESSEIVCDLWYQDDRNASVSSL